jgi:hypothetical protein
MPTTEQINQLLALKAVCALSNTLRVAFGEEKTALAQPNFVKSILADFSERLGQVQGEPEIDSLRQEIDVFIVGLSDSTTNGEVAEMFLKCHHVIDPIYWRVSTEMGMPHP